jgi:DNA invertase Pin-like site-specific DNA recombinase
MHWSILQLSPEVFCCRNYILWYHFAMSCNTVIYARTSPDCPLSADEQIERLKTVAAEHGWTVSKVFIDRPATVKKDRRTGEIALIEAIRNGDVEKVLIYGIDRVGRSLVDLVGFIETCRASTVTLWLDEQKLDTASANGLTLFDLSGMLAFHLRQMRRDRILRGQAAARVASVRFGRPPIPIGRAEKAKRELSSGKSVRHVAKLAGISAASVSRLKKSTASASATI